MSSTGESKVVAAGLHPCRKGSPMLGSNDDRSLVRVLRVTHSDKAGQLGRLDAGALLLAAAPFAPSRGVQVGGSWHGYLALRSVSDHCSASVAIMLIVSSGLSATAVSRIRTHPRKGSRHALGHSADRRRRTAHLVRVGHQRAASECVSVGPGDMPQPTIKAMVAVLERQFPGTIVWYGRYTRHWWALVTIGAAQSWGRWRSPRL